MAKRRTRARRARPRTNHAAGSRRGAGARGRLTTFAELALYSALFVTLFAVVSGAVGAQRKGGRHDLTRVAHRAMLVAAILLVGATLGLTLALSRPDLSLRYVAEHTTLNLPMPYRISALWSGAAGQRLLWALLLVLCATLGSWDSSTHRRSVLLLALAVLGTVTLATLGLPFRRLAWHPGEGLGMLPSLQSPVQAVRIPLVILCLALLIVAGALALDRTRQVRVARWLLAAAACSTLSLALGFAAADHFELPDDRALLLVGPLWISCAVLLMLPPVRAAWWPRRRRASLGLVGVLLGGSVLAVASLGGRARSTTRTVWLGQGETTRVRSAFGAEWTLAQQGVSGFRSRNREVTAVTVEASTDNTRALLVTERRQSVDSREELIFQPLVTTAVARRTLEDLAVTVLQTAPNENAELRVEFRPLASWLWVGFALLLIAILGAWLVLFGAPNAQSSPNDVVRSREGETSPSA